MKIEDCKPGTKVAIYGGVRQMLKTGGVGGWVNTHRLIGHVTSNGNGVQVACKAPQGDMLEDGVYLCHPKQLRRIVVKKKEAQEAQGCCCWAFDHPPCPVHPKPPKP